MNGQVSIIGVGQTPTGEHWELSLRHLALQAMQAALADAGMADPGQIDALVVGNALAGSLSDQNNVGVLLADFAGMRGIEAFRAEGGDASGALALRMGALLIASGAARTVMVVGAEKITDTVGSARIAALSTLLDSEYEAAQGATPVGLMAMLMRRYMHEYGVDVAKFANFSVNAHANGSKNPNAMYRNTIKADRFASAPLVAEPINLFDVAPEVDGAAAVILTSTERAGDMVPHPVKVLASAVGTDSLALHDRPNMLHLAAVQRATNKALSMANLTPEDIDVAELHDSATIMTTLALEASGFAAPGQGWKMAAEGRIMPNGDLPISTFGGLKSRGNALGATGVYQAVEIVLQLRGLGGPNQISGARIGMAQNLAGLGGLAVTHVFGV
jgi:acetyl-CoA C-acetyltransferase